MTENSETVEIDRDLIGEEELYEIQRAANYFDDEVFFELIESERQLVCKDTSYDPTFTSQAVFDSSALLSMYLDECMFHDRSDRVETIERVATALRSTGALQ